MGHPIAQELSNLTKNGVRRPSKGEINLSFNLILVGFWNLFIYKRTATINILPYPCKPDLILNKDLLINYFDKNIEKLNCANLQNMRYEFITLLVCVFQTECKIWNFSYSLKYSWFLRKLKGRLWDNDLEYPTFHLGWRLGNRSDHSSTWRTYKCE